MPVLSARQRTVVPAGGGGRYHPSPQRQLRSTCSSRANGGGGDWGAGKEVSDRGLFCRRRRRRSRYRAAVAVPPRPTVAAAKS